MESSIATNFRFTLQTHQRLLNRPRTVRSRRVADRRYQVLSASVWSQISQNDRIRYSLDVDNSSVARRAQGLSSLLHVFHRTRQTHLFAAAVASFTKNTTSDKTRVDIIVYQRKCKAETRSFDALAL